MLRACCAAGGKVVHNEEVEMTKINKVYIDPPKMRDDDRHLDGCRNLDQRTNTEKHA